MKPIASVLLPVTLAGAVACGPAGSDDGSDAAEWSISAEPILSIGELDGPDEYLFQQVVDAALLPDGRVAVADGGLSVIRVFDAEGRFVVEMGGKGEGPWEFTRLSGIWLAGPDTIGGFDPRLKRIETYLADGSPQGSHQLTAPGGDERPEGTLDTFVGAFEDGSLAGGWIGFGGQLETGRIVADPFSITRFGADGRYLGKLLDATGFQRTMFESERGGPVAYTPVPYSDVHGDSLYFTDGLRPVVSVLGPDGTEGRVITVPAPVHDVDAALAALEPRLSDSGMFNTVEQLHGSPRPEAIPRVAGLRVDDGGHVWVRRYDVPDDALWLSPGIDRLGGTWWVFDPAGDLAATVTLPDGLRVLDLRGDRLLGLERDELDVERIVVYSIDR